MHDNKICFKFGCFDYIKQINFEKVECDEILTGWHPYYDEIAKAKYWYNWDTGEATWIDPKTKDVVLGRGGKRKTKNKRKCKRKTKSKNIN